MGEKLRGDTTPGDSGSNPPNQATSVYPKQLKEGVLITQQVMQHTESRPSYLLMGLIEKSELRELLDEVYFYAL